MSFRSTYKPRRSVRAGISLVEMLVVMAVLVAMINLLLPLYQQVLDKTYVAVMKVDLQRYALAQEEHRDIHKVYATNPTQTNFEFSDDVGRLSSSGSPKRWSLAVRHDKTEYMCSLNKGMGSLNRGKVYCGKPHVVEFTVSTANPAAGDTVVFDATQALSHITFTNQVDVSASAGFLERLPGALWAQDDEWAPSIQASHLVWHFGDGTETVGFPATHARVPHVYPMEEDGEYAAMLEIATPQGVRFWGMKEIKVSPPTEASPVEPEPEEPAPVEPEPEDSIPVEPEPEGPAPVEPDLDPSDPEPSDTVSAGPVAGFRVLPAPLRVDKKVKFKAEGWENSPENFRWDFGDGVICTGSFPEHIYREPGEYTVVLSVDYPHGYSGHAQQTITVDAKQDNRPSPPQTACEAQSRGTGNGNGNGGGKK